MKRKAIWIGDSLKRLKEFPEEVQIVFKKIKAWYQNTEIRNRFD